jgi:adenylate cyclase
MSEAPQRRLAAIVSADVVGYSRLMGADEAGTHARLQARFGDLVQPKLIEHRGRVVKLMGDGLLAEFSSVVDAVNWAVAVQTEAAQLNHGESDDKRIEYRVGINLGDVIVDGDDIFGDGVNVAARLQESAEPGGIAISDIVQGQIRDKLDVDFSDSGDVEMKNIAQPVHVWRWHAIERGSAPHAAAEQGAALPLPEKPSIAVLPFDNMSGDPEQEYFSDGISEDIITALSKFRWFFVSARNSTFTYKGQAVEITQVGRELGVRYVLEGSVRKAGSRVRITAQLIEAASGNHIWAERYDRELVDIFDLQDEMQQAIVAAVEPEMAGAEMERAAKKSPQLLDAWDLFQQANWHFNQRSAADTDLAEPLYEKVVALDPSFAPAYAMHAWLLHNGVAYGFRTDRDGQLNKGLKLAQLGVLKDDRDALTHFALGRIMSISGDLAGGIREQRLAVQLNPNFSFAAWGLGEALGRAGQFEEALETIDVALRLSPRDPLRFLFFLFKGKSHDGLGQIEAAEAAYRESVALNRRVPTVIPNIVLIEFLARRDRLEEARGLMTELLGLHPEINVASVSPQTEAAWDVFKERWRDNLVAAGLPE